MAATRVEVVRQGLQPLEGAREALHQLRAAGHTVVIYTARGWG